MWYSDKWQSSEQQVRRRTRWLQRVEQTRPSRRAVSALAQMAGVTKVPERRRRSVSAPWLRSQKKGSPSTVKTFDTPQNPQWEKRQPEKDLQVSDEGERQSLGSELEDEAGRGHVGNSVREI